MLTDFGIAQFEGDPRLTQTGMVMGSPGFTAPERIRGSDATPASDLWSLGATIYAAVEGTRAVRAARRRDHHDVRDHQRGRARRAARSGQLAPLIAALLRRDPSARPSAAAAARMFSDVLPLLSGAAAEPEHPATVMSAYVPPPAAPAASAAAEAAAPASGPAVDEALEEPPGGSAEIAPAAVGNVAAGGLDVAGEEHAGGEGAAVAAAALAGVGVAAAADAAVDEAVTAPVVPVAPAAQVSPAVAEPAPGPGPAAAEPGPAAPEVSDLPAPEAPAAATSIDPVLHNLAPPKPRPSFSAAQPARTDPPTTPAPSYEATQYSDSNPQWRAGSGDQWGADPQRGSNAQWGSSAQWGSNAQQAGPNQQYAGPSQPYPDLAQEYAPGTVGRPQRSRRGRKIALIAGAIVIVAAAGGGAALALRHPGAAASGTTANTVKPSPKTPFGSVNALNTLSTTLPSGWTADAVQPSDTSTTGGFSIDVPPGWSETHSGKATHFDGPGGIFLEVDLTPHTYQNMVTEAQYIKKQSLAKGGSPGTSRTISRACPSGAPRGRSGSSPGPLRESPSS